MTIKRETFPGLNWGVAALLFGAGANVVSLIVPLAPFLVAVALLLFLTRYARASVEQGAVLGIAMAVAAIGSIRSETVAEIVQNCRQLLVGFSAFVLVATIKDDMDDVFDKFFRVFTWVSLLGFAFYIVWPDFQMASVSIGDRSYLIGPSSRILDRQVGAASLFAGYRFQGLLDEPGTYGAFAAAAIYYAWRRGWRLAAAALLGSLVASESVGGFISLIALWGWDWASRQSFGWKLISLLAILLVVAAIWWSPLGRQIEQGWDLFITLRTASGQTRGDQMTLLTTNWESLLLPGGFSDAAILRIVPQSITVGWGRSLVSFGIIAIAMILVLLIIAFRRSSLTTSSGVLLACMVLSGLSRSGLFDLFIGWLVLLQKLSPDLRTASPGKVDAPRLQITAAN